MLGSVLLRGTGTSPVLNSAEVTHGRGARATKTSALAPMMCGLPDFERPSVSRFEDYFSRQQDFKCYLYHRKSPRLEKQGGLVTRPILFSSFARFVSFCGNPNSSPFVFLRAASWIN